MGVSRVRTVEGSCWSCRKRRVKCDLTRPQCSRCSKIGASCDYNTHLLRWRTTGCGSPLDEPPPLASHEERALGYFKDRFWPLLTTAAEPCPPPISLALENKVLLLATCLLADTHRVLQDGRNSRRVPQIKRLECLSAVRCELRETCESDRPPMVNLLVTVLLLYFHAGYLECAGLSGAASTASHHAGVNAIIARLGGLDVVLDTGPAALHMLVSEFATTDLTRCLLAGGRPSFAPETWDSIDRRSVWWTRDSLGRISLAGVLSEMSRLAHYRADVRDGMPPCAATVAGAQHALAPVFAPLDDALAGEAELDAVHTYSLVRSFQHVGLIFLYRAVCDLPANHALVQQHVRPCIECILSIEKPAKVLNCVVFPLLVAGAHLQSTSLRRAVSNVLSSVHGGIKFASFRSVAHVLEDLWRRDTLGVLPWDDMFSGLGPDALVL